MTLAHTTPPAMRFLPPATTAPALNMAALQARFDALLAQDIAYHAQYAGLQAEGAAYRAEGDALRQEYGGFQTQPAHDAVSIVHLHGWGP